MRGCAVGLVVLIACRDGGVVVKVDPKGIAIDEVRLFLGTGSAATTMLQPPPMQAPAAATFWGRDPNNAGDHSTDASARFVLVDDGTATTLPAAIAVGYQGGVAVAVASQLDLTVASSDYDVYTMPLVARTDFQVWSPSPTGAATDAACVGVDGNFIVTAGDRDCDGVPDSDPLECDPDVYHEMRSPMRDDTTCTTQAQSTTCYLGGPACEDGKPPDVTQCLPTRYCASTQLCTACAGIACASDITPLAPRSRPYYLDCLVPTNDSGAFCSPSVAIPAYTNAVGCTDAAIRDVETGFGTKLDHDLGNGNKIKLALDHTGTACNLTLETSGTVKVTNVANDQPVGALLALDFTNGRAAAIPVYLHVRSGCQVAATCVFVTTANDPGIDLRACAGLP